LPVPLEAFRKAELPGRELENFCFKTRDQLSNCFEGYSYESKVERGKHDRSLGSVNQVERKTSIGNGKRGVDQTPLAASKAGKKTKTKGKGGVIPKNQETLIREHWLIKKTGKVIEQVPAGGRRHPSQCCDLGRALEWGKLSNYKVMLRHYNGKTRKNGRKRWGGPTATNGSKKGRAQKREEPAWTSPWDSPT